MLAELVDAVVGVDTHRDSHEVEIAFPTGIAIGTRKISNDDSGFAELLAWIVDHAPGPRVVVAIEGTRSFGVGLARAVAAAGLTVVECEQPNRQARRGRGKSDPIDAHLAVLAALRLDADRLPTPRADGDREALRILLGARHELTVVTTAQVNRLRALLLGGDDTERDLARATLTDPILVAMARRRPAPHTSREQAIRHSEIRRLARVVQAGRRALTANRAQLQTIVEEMAPGLTERHGIGAVTAAQVIVSFSHPGRCRSDAAFAALSGTSPLPASSGRTVRHRLNRGGDRALNRAIHIITLTRMRCCPTTKQYIARRIAEGKSSREIQRCLKRYIARELFRTLNANSPSPLRLQFWRPLDKHRSVKCSDARKPHWASGIQRCIYDDHPPILSVTDTHVPVSATVRDTSQVTAEDVRLRRLAPRFRMLSTGVRARPRRTGWRQAHPLKG